MKGPHIELHIEELVLHGFARGDRYAIADAFERELSRLLSAQFAEQGVPHALAHNTERAHLDGGKFQVEPNSRADAVGSQVAQAVYGGINR